MNNTTTIETPVLFEDDFGQVMVIDGEITAPLGTLLDWRHTLWYLLESAYSYDDLSGFWQAGNEVADSGLLGEEVWTGLTVEDVEAIKRVLAAEDAKNEERRKRKEAAEERKRAKARERYAVKKAATQIALAAD